MSHAVETMAYTNEVPWHGLGTYIEKAPTVAKMLKLADLDWKVEKRPLAFDLTSPDADGNDFEGAVPDKYALVRTSDQKCLDVCGAQYTPVQNEQAFDFFTDFVEAGDATMETAGSLRGGRYVWGLARLGHDFELANNDKVKGYLLVAAPHESGKSFIIKFTTIRVVCNNTLTLSLREGGTEFRMAHRRAFDEKMIDRAKETLGVAHEQMSEFEVNARLLQSLNLSRDDAVRILAPVYQPQVEVKDLVDKFDDIACPRMKRILDINEKAPGAEPGTGWGVLNAVTYYSDHVASRTNDKRLTNAWFGKTANQKERVMTSLLEMAQ